MLVSESRSVSRWALLAFVVAGVVSFASGLYVWRPVGAMDAAWMPWRKGSIEVWPATIDVGNCRIGDAKPVRIRVENRYAQPVTLTGLHTPCSCLGTSELPIQLESRSATTLLMTVHATGEPGDFRRQVLIYTNSSSCPELAVTIVGRIVDVQHVDLRPVRDSIETLVRGND